VVCPEIPQEEAEPSGEEEILEDIGNVISLKSRRKK